MKCPVCREINLVMADRNGIEIDYCPNCRGVWLDRGELDKIIERAGAAPAPAPRPQAYADDRDDSRHQHRDNDYAYGKKKKRGGFLGEIFDFD